MGARHARRRRARRSSSPQSRLCPPGAFGPFGPWAAQLGNADFCLGWPSPSGGAALGTGPLPNVPMLAVSGGFDLRTPTANAVSVVARFPQGKLLVVPGVGHSTLTADFSGCAVAGRPHLDDRRRAPERVPALAAPRHDRAGPAGASGAACTGSRPAPRLRS